MKKDYIAPEVEVISFEVEETIMVSLGGEDTDTPDF